MVSFIRAHSSEQRELRRAAILDTAREMLKEMPEAKLTLNGLSRRACMAKSNVLRYFESREDVLLELCAQAMDEWMHAVDDALASGVDPAASASIRGEQLNAIVATTLAERPILCELLSAQASVLEHNVSTAVVLRFKRVMVANVERLSAIVIRCLPELGIEDAARFSAMASMLTSSVWVHSHPPPAVEAAYDADESVRPYRMEFVPALRDALDVILAGLLSQRGRRPHAD